MSEELVPMTIGWFDMPLEMREMVMEQMEVKTKGKLLQCSKECSDEVKGMKNFIRRIRLILSSSKVCIQVSFFGAYMGIQIEKFNDKVLISYNSSNYMNKYFSEILVGSFNKIALNHIKNWIYHPVDLETFDVKLADFPCIDFDITHFKKLKSITINSRKSLDAFLKMRFIGKDQFYSIENLTLVNVKLTNKEFCGLKASSVQLNNTNVSAKNLNHFLQSWKHGNIDKNFTKMKIEMKDRRRFREISSIILKDVDAIGQHKKHDCIWARFMNENNEWAEIHMSHDSSDGRLTVIMICKTSADKFQYKGFDWEDELRMEELDDVYDINDLYPGSYSEDDGYEGIYY
ncbi:unnamed protein product [Caenorhabditis angaria]|uniref:F-box associated domain-containing protein n=1 Tax=Caenorhabditis angaria TaxID=860376 RepID=A0A9P1MUC9_9PELO|nr:unnamed protein product [Caenorhabditis angaria]